MKYKVLLLNYDCEWVTYCNSTTLQFAVEACADLRRRGFNDLRAKIVKEYET